MTIAPLFYSGNKHLEEVQQIVTSSQVANLAKQAISITKNQPMMVKKKSYNNKLQDLDQTRNILIMARKVTMLRTVQAVLTQKKSQMTKKQNKK